MRFKHAFFRKVEGKRMSQKPTSNAAWGTWRKFKGPGRIDLGFTLIELLIVIANITILASIAVPNYQDALVKSKCAKFMGDCKAVETALEVYYSDHGAYPPEDRYPVGTTDSNWYMNPSYPAAGFLSRWLTTPIAYLGKMPMDPFPNNSSAYDDEYQYPKRRPCNYSNDMQNSKIYRGSANQYYVSWVYQLLRSPQGSVVVNSMSRPNAAIWMINSAGPDSDRDHGLNGNYVGRTDTPVVDSEMNMYPLAYDPSNGTLSDGDLFMFGPGIGFPGH
jgi:prepilin-type N-terminal cleavage/methylation domain-containing protein